MKLSHLTKCYGKRCVFRDFSLDIQSGEILCVLGESGGGKTTLLNSIAGLISYEGRIENVPERISYVFQEPRLLPHLSVRENLRFVGGRDEVIDGILAKVELSDKADSLASRLSGGEKPRVALARAFSTEFSLLLMDEPFSSLDTGLKIRLTETFATLWKTYGGKRTAVMVTHDVEEALMLADRIVVLKGGEICFDKRVERTRFPEKYGEESPLRGELLNVLIGENYGL